ncbi:ESX secretion-associated protein EspG [Actinophytocola gossypii]|uniref:ESX secretion-associated protein EspG n=1 Tax=Actinophytocola gossypii TaxID=2812003 RepID=A0ABT2J3V2_9PSEU|nr:ESX secretion-associated protein EspG [Actinophytocola gossypii]MCT2582533.1 ESX secretion-associated protein EspG [Actinophytocola gossypii]
MNILSPLELDFLWESVGAGELPYPLESRSHGTTVDERGALRRRVLGDRPVVDHVEDWLTVLARADRSVDAVFLAEPDARPTSAIAAALDDRALLATQHGDGVSLRPIDPVSLASSVVDLLPAAPRGTEPSVTMPADELAAGGRTGADREVLARFAEQRHLRVGQLAANARRLGGRARSPVLSWFDTDTGRYLTYTTDGWVTIAPADAPTLRHRLIEMLGSLVR